MNTKQFTKSVQCNFIFIFEIKKIKKKKRVQK